MKVQNVTIYIEIQKHLVNISFSKMVGWGLVQITPASKQLVSFCSTSSSHTRLAERIGLEEYLTDMLDLTGQTDKKKSYNWVHG